MTKIRKAPRWCGVFLRALAGCGEVRRAAAMAGVDFTTAYLRRKTHSDFAQGWAEALAAFGAGEGEDPSTIGSAADGSPPHASHREELLVLQPGAGGVRAARAGAGRWNAAAERRFFTALGDRANVRHAAVAAGFSTNAIYARRSKRPEFRRAWEAAVETGKARLQMLLMDAAERAFDPELLDVSEEAPKVSVAEALNILKSGEGKDRELGAGRGWIDYPDGEAQENQEACERIIVRLGRLKERDIEDQTEAGWVHCAEHDMMIPPGWVRDPDYVQPPPLENMCEGERLGLTYEPPSA